MLLKFNEDDKSWVIDEMSDAEADELMKIGKNVFIQHMASKMFAQMAESHGLESIPAEHMGQA